MVMIKKMLKYFLPGRSFTLRGYAARYSTTTENTVPIIVYLKLFKIPVKILGSANTDRYPSKVNWLGRRKVFPAYTSYGSDTEAINT